MRASKNSSIQEDHGSSSKIQTPIGGGGGIGGNLQSASGLIGSNGSINSNSG